MDAYDVTKVVYSRVQAMESEHSSKIMGYLLLQDDGEQEMFRLAFSHDSVLQSVVMKVKKELGLSVSSSSSSSSSSSTSSSASSQSSYGNPYAGLNSSSSVSLLSSSTPASPRSFLSFHSHQVGSLLLPPLPSSPLSSSASLENQLNSSFLHGQDHYHDASHSEHLSLRAASDHPSLASQIRLNSRLALHEQLSMDRFSAERSKLHQYHQHYHPQSNPQHSELFHEQAEQGPYPFSNEFLQSDPHYSNTLLNSRLINGENFQTSFHARRFSAADLIPMSPESLASASPAWKPCLYYGRGFCKHGSNCKFLHSHGHGHCRSEAGFLLSPSNGVASPQAHDSGSDDGTMSTGSLERLEYEIQELLRGRKAPISIASLPQLYYERFGKTLQADGYLTESQRHGKAGYSLTKLLARLKNSVTLIDRPHGQHAVVLAEDAFKFTGFRSGDQIFKEDAMAGEFMNSGSRQIYLTFPADSAFSEEDVSSYFRAYGPVQDVRIPYQQKRMFGFVTFIYPETVKTILANGNPHFICGARVLVKPYKEKGKHADRKSSSERDGFNRFHSHGMQPSDVMRANADSIAGPRAFMEHDGALRRQLEKQEMILEMERRRLAELQFEKHRMQQILLSPTSVPEDSRQSSFASPPMSSFQSEAFSLDMNSSDYGSISEDPNLLFTEDRLDLKPIQTSVPSDSNGKGSNGSGKQKEETDKQSDEHNLPDSPFTSPHKPYSSLSEEVIPNDDLLKNISTGPVPPGFSLPSHLSDNLNCRSCKA